MDEETILSIRKNLISKRYLALQNVTRKTIENKESDLFRFGFILIGLTSEDLDLAEKILTSFEALYHIKPDYLIEEKEL